MCVLLSLFWPTFQSLIYELVDEDGCSSSFDISTRITQCAGFSSIRMYDDHDEVSHWVKSEESEDCKHVFFWFFLARRSWYILKVSEPVSCILGTGKKYRYRYRSKLWVPSHSDIQDWELLQPCWKIRNLRHWLEDWFWECSIRPGETWGPDDFKAESLTFRFFAFLDFISAQQTNIWSTQKYWEIHHTLS